MSISLQKNIPCLFLLLCLVFLPSESSVVFAEDRAPLCNDLRDISIEGLRSMGVGEFMSLLDIRKGMPVYQEALSRSLKRIFQKGIFEDIIIVLQRNQEPSCNIAIEVIERFLINSIDIQGNQLVSSSFIRKHLDIEKGQVLQDKKIEEGIKRLKTQMMMIGFPRAEVAYTIVSRNNFKADIIISVQEGTPELIRQIRLQDSAGLLSRYLQLSEGEPFSILSIDRAKERIKDYLKKNLYIQTDLSYSFKEGILEVSLHRGRQLRVSLTGNEEIDSSSILRELPDPDFREFSEEIIQEFQKRIIKLYFSRGFPFVQVIPSSEQGEDVIDLNFYIYEGSRYVVEGVRFLNTSLSEDKLKGLLNLRKGVPYNPEMLSLDIDILTDFYLSLGYSNVAVSKPEVALSEEGVNIIFTVNEGTLQRVRNIYFQDNDILSSEILQRHIPLKTGGSLNEIDIAESKRVILDTYRRLGFAEVQVSISKELHQEGIDITFSIKENQPILFGKTLFKGNRQTRYQVLTRELIHRESDLFQQSILLKERQRLYKTGLFSDIEIETTEPYRRKEQDDMYYKDVMFTVHEAPAGAFEFGVGYGEYEHFRGFAEVSYKNLWGMNRQGSFRTELSSVEQRYILSYFDPWFFRESLPLKTLLLHEKRIERSIDTRTVRYRLYRTIASAGIERKLSPNLNMEFFYDFSVVNTYDVQPDIILSREDTGTLIISALRPGLIYDTRDNPFDPKEGILAGITAKLASFAILSQTDFIKLSFYANHYHSLSKKLVFALSVRGGIAKGFRETQELPIVERFFLGGRTTVRGYEQDTLGHKGADGNPTGGNLFAMTNLELRADIGKGIGIVAFVDSGNVWQTSSDLTGLKYTAGIGLRYNTPVGPFRVDYGLKLNRNPGESRGEIHFSLGHAF